MPSMSGVFVLVILKTEGTQQSILYFSEAGRR